MSQESVSAEARELVERYINGEASDDDMRRLEIQLKADVAVLDFYLDYVNLHSALRRRYLTGDEANSDDSKKAVDLDSGRQPVTSLGLGWTLSTALWLASTLAVVALAYFVWQAGWQNPADQGLATIRYIEGEVSLVLGSDTKVAQVGDALRTGESLRVADDSARACLEYPDGTQVRVHSTSVVQAPLNREICLRLLSGSIEVEMSPQPSETPLTFAADHSHYVALGKFRLYRDESASRLELDSGKVRVERPERGESVDVIEGSVAVVSDDATPVDVQPLAYGRAEPVQSISRAGERVVFADDGQVLFTNQFDAGLKKYRLGEAKPLEEYRADAGGSDGLALTTDRQALIQVNRNGYVLAWMLQEKSKAIKLPLPGKETRSRALSADGSTVVESSRDETRVYSIDLSERKLRERFSFKSPGKAWCLALSRDGGRLAAGFWDGTIQVYDVTARQLLFERKLLHTPTHVDLTAGGDRLVVFTQRDGIKWINVVSGEQHSLWPGGLARARCLQFTPDGKHVIAGMNDRTARMWSVEDGRQLLVVEVGYSPQGIAWLADRQMLATADGAVKLWKCTLDSAGRRVE